MNLPINLEKPKFKFKGVVHPNQFIIQNYEFLLSFDTQWIKNSLSFAIDTMSKAFNGEVCRFVKDLNSFNGLK